MTRASTDSCHWIVHRMSSVLVGEFAGCLCITCDGTPLQFSIGTLGTRSSCIDSHSGCDWGWAYELPAGHSICSFRNWVAWFDKFHGGDVWCMSTKQEGSGSSSKCSTAVAPLFITCKQLIQTSVLGICGIVCCDAVWQMIKASFNCKAGSEGFCGR